MNTLAALFQSLIKSEYAIYQDVYQLNIVGIRSNTALPNRFDDQIHVFYKNQSGSWLHHYYLATTDPGTYWLHHPMNPQGTAILAQGQYRDAYQIGLHLGKYHALVQRLPVTVIRDYDRDSMLDFFNGKAHTGLFGINIHRATANGTSLSVDRHSAGCQVFARSRDYEEFMRLCDRHRTLYGNKFTYTLIDQRALERTTLRQATLTIGSLGAAACASLLVYHLLKK